MISNCGTRYTAFDLRNLLLVSEDVEGIAHIDYKKVTAAPPSKFAVIWNLEFINSYGLKVYSERLETRFDHVFSLDIERDFLNLKMVLFRTVLFIREGLISRDEQLLLPEIKLDELTCDVLEKIIREG